MFRSSVQGGAGGRAELGSRAVAQAVSRQPVTAETRVNNRAPNVGFLVEKMEIGKILYKYFGFSAISIVTRVLHTH